MPDHANLTTHKAGVQRQLLQRRSGAAQEQVVDRPLMSPRQGTQRRRQREGDEEVRHGQQQRPLLRQPGLGSILLALGTVPVAARMVAVPGFVTRGTVVDLTPQRRGSALLDGRHHRQMAGRYAQAILRPIGGAVGAKDVSQLYHANPAITRLMVALASVSAPWVRWV